MLEEIICSDTIIRRKFKFFESHCLFVHFLVLKPFKYGVTVWNASKFISVLYNFGEM